jgi:hypothetical protein
MTEEEKIEAAKQEAVAELKAQAEKEKAAMIAELQAERQKRQAAEEELKTKGVVSHSGDGEDPKKVFEELLEEKEHKEAIANKKAAIEEFKQTNREFSEENDATGIIFSSFEKELRKFNLEGLKSKEDFKRRFNEVYEFMNRKVKTEEQKGSYYQGSKQGYGSDPKEGDRNNLSDAEKRLLKEMNWTEERYLKLKASQPAQVASLLSWRS